jgi:putative two-component system response regulator
VAVADAFDAMTHDRPYRDALPVDEAFDLIAAGAGTKFDPQVSAAALRRREEIAALV